MKKILRIVLVLSLLGLFGFLGEDFKVSRAQTPAHTPVFSHIKTWKSIYGDPMQTPGATWDWIKSHYDWLQLYPDPAVEYRTQGGTAPLNVYWEYNSITAQNDYAWFRAWSKQNGISWEDFFVHFNVNTVHRPAYEGSGSDASKEDRFDAVYVYNGTSYTDQTTNAYSGNSFNIGSADGWALYIGYEESFKEANFSLQTSSSGWSGVWEYWNGSSWASLNPTDGTANLTQNGKVEFTPPLSSWQRNLVNNKELWWVRLRTINSGSIQPVVAGGGLKGRNFITFGGGYYTQPGWDPANDPNQDGYAEINNNPNATAKFRYEARVHYYEFITTYLNMGNQNIRSAIAQRARDKLTTPIKTGFPYTYDAMFLDNATRALTLHNRQSGGTTVEDTSDSAWQANSLASIKAIKVANQDKIIYLNTSQLTGSPYEEYIDAADGYHGETYIAIDRVYRQGQIDAIISRDNKGKWAQIHAQGEGAVGGDLDRDRIFSLATFYLSKGQNTYYGFGMDGRGPTGSRTFYEQFYGAIAFNIGQPKGSYYVLHQEDDPSCPHNTYGIAYMYAREFDNALVVSLPKPDWDSTYTPSYTTQLPTYDIGGGQTSSRYHKLNVDGSIDPNIITSITLRNAEGAILIKETVEISKQVDKATASSGEILTYTLFYNNSGESTLQNAKIEDSIPSGTTYVNGSATNNGTFDGIKVVWNLGNLTPGASGQVQFQVRIE